MFRTYSFLLCATIMFLPSWHLLSIAANECKPVGVYEVSIEYTQKNYKKTYKSIFLLVEDDNNKEKVDVYNIIVDTSKALEFKRNSLSPVFHNRIYHEVVITGKCNHYKSDNGLVKPDVVHSNVIGTGFANLMSNKAYKQTIRNNGFICPVDLYYFGDGYRSGTGLLSNQDSPIMPLTYSDVIKVRSYNVKRSISKIDWSDSYVSDLNNLKDFIERKYKQRVPSERKYSEIIFKDTSINRLLKDLLNVRNKLVKDNYYNKSNPNTSLNELAYLGVNGYRDEFEYVNNNCTIVNNILKGDSTSYLGKLLEVLTASDSTEAGEIDNLLKRVQLELQSIESSIYKKRDLTNSHLEQKNILEQKISHIDKYITNINELGEHLTKIFADKKYLLDTNFTDSQKKVFSKFYVHFPNGLNIDIRSHSNYSDVIRNKIKQDKVIDSAYHSEKVITWQETVYDDIRKVILKLSMLLNSTDGIDEYVDKSISDKLKSSIKRITQTLTVPDDSSLLVNVNIDKDLNELLNPYTYTKPQQLINPIVEFIRNGNYNNYTLPYGSSRSSSFDIYDVNKKPFLVANALRYISDPKTYDTIILHNMFQSFFFNTELFKNLTRDSLTQLLKSVRSDIQLNKLNPAVVNVNYQGRIIEVNENFSQLHTILTEIVSSLENQLNAINSQLSELSAKNDESLIIDIPTFIQSTDEFKANYEKYSPNRFITLIPIDSLINIVQLRRSYSNSTKLNIIDSIYLIYNLKHKTPRDIIKIKSIEYNRQLTYEEERAIWILILNKYKLNYPNIPYDDYKYVMNNRRVYETKLAEKLEKNGLQYSLNPDKYRTAPLALIQYLNEDFVQLDKSCLDALSSLYPVDLKKYADNKIFIDSAYNATLHDVENRLNYYKSKYPGNPFQLKEDSISYKVIKEKYDNVTKLYEQMFPERRNSVVSINNIQSNIPLVKDSNLHMVYQDWIKSKGTSSIWQSDSYELRSKIINDFILKSEGFSYKWSDVNYDLLSGEWILESKFDNSVPSIDNVNFANFKCMRLGFKYLNSKIDIKSFFISTECY